MLEKLKDMGAGISEMAKGFLDRMKESARIKAYENSPANLDDAGEVDDIIISIFNDTFPGNNFTRENIKALVKQAGLTNGEFMTILDDYAFPASDTKPGELIPDSIKAKFKK